MRLFRNFSPLTKEDKNGFFPENPIKTLTEESKNHRKQVTFYYKFNRKQTLSIHNIRFTHGTLVIILNCSNEYLIFLGIHIGYLFEE
jgi:hypothetical protein